jgi:hypothetical protein
VRRCVFIPDTGVEASIFLWYAPAREMRKISVIRAHFVTGGQCRLCALLALSPVSAFMC